MHAHNHGLQLATKAPDFGNTSYAILMKLVRGEAADLFAGIEQFLASHGDALPPGGRAGLTDLLGYRKSIVDPDNLPAMATGSAALAFKLASVDYHLADREVRWRSAVERAFLHLDRLIVADPDVQAKWAAALQKGETRCERLGGAHLLHHGIWAFKAHGEGERTDLVLGTPVSPDDLDRVTRAAELMILTEWKCVDGASELPRKHGEAMRQLQRYGLGVLAGFEMRSTRYIVTVAADRLATFPDVTHDGVTYRHVHVAVEPGSPSEESRRAPATVT